MMSLRIIKVVKMRITLIHKSLSHRTNNVPAYMNEANRRSTDSLGHTEYGYVWVHIEG